MPRAPHVALNLGPQREIFGTPSPKQITGKQQNPGGGKTGPRSSSGSSRCVPVRRVQRHARDRHLLSETPPPPPATPALEPQVAPIDQKHVELHVGGHRAGGRPLFARTSAVTSSPPCSTGLWITAVRHDLRTKAPRRYLGAHGAPLKRRQGLQRRRVGGVSLMCRSEFCDLLGDHRPQTTCRDTRYGME
jgi:hypothetical protein